MGRRCEKCGAPLTDEDVMKIKNENGSWETIPIPLCPDCFTKQMREHARTHQFERRSKP